MGNDFHAASSELLYDIYNGCFDVGTPSAILGSSSGMAISNATGAVKDRVARVVTTRRTVRPEHISGSIISVSNLSPQWQKNRTED
ncbi:hypothetical protein H2248_005505 [Termitomyces sp. 'cryptogamus']|nr:hypothetical protein H2248_005505 [Termitomyces sp. 'cryptogamus']